MKNSADIHASMGTRQAQWRRTCRFTPGSTLAGRLVRELGDADRTYARATNWSPFFVPEPILVGDAQLEEDNEHNRGPARVRKAPGDPRRAPGSNPLHDDTHHPRSSAQGG